MARSTRRALSMTFLVLLMFSSSLSRTQPLMTIGGYEKVSEVRVTRTVTEYVYRATLTNAGPVLAGVTALASSGASATTIVEGTLTFGPVGTGGSVASADTFAFRHDRTVPFDFANILWSFSPVVGNRPPVANAGPDQAIDGVGAFVTLDGTGSSDPDGDTLHYTWTLIERPAGSTAALSSPATVSPTFVPDRKGTYTARLVVNDGALASAPDTVQVIVANTAPVANAGPDQTAGVATTVTLTGAGSSDIDGDALTFNWAFQSRPAGSSAVLLNETSVNPTFTVDIPGNYIVRLLVNDGTVNSVADTVVVNTDNSAPVANAGPDQTAFVAQTVTLNGSSSSDVDGDALTFAWAFASRPAGSTAVLNNAAAVQPTFVVDRPGTYRLRLTVNDGTVDSAPDFIDITTENSAPIANAGADRTSTVGSTVTLNGSGSTDVDGDALTYLWSFTSVPTGSAATLSNPTGVMPSFVIDVFGVYVVQLIVNDGIGPSAPDTVTITTENSAPTANAGPDQSVTAGDTVFLDGTASSDPDGNALTFAWAFTARPSGSSATLVNSLTPSPSFTADRPGTYIAQLRVNDGTVDSPADTVTITTTNSTPVANAGPDQIDVPAGSTVTLNGSASSDADGHALTFSWSLLTRPVGSVAALNNTAAVGPTFTADVAGDYVAQLIVNDGFGPSAPDTVLVRVVNAALPEVTIVATDGSASESGGTGFFTVSRTGPTTNALTVGYAIGGSASNGTDYLTIATSVIIPAGASSATIAITPISDALAEGDEGVTLTISSSVNYSIGSPGAATVTIGDAAPAPVVTVAATDAAASEIGPDVGVFRFSRTGATTAPLTVAYTVSGTALNGTDYTTISGSIVIPGGQPFADLTITPAGDSTPEPAETVTVTITDAPSYDPGSPAAATVTIADGSPSVTVSATDSSASEVGPDTGTFTFTRTGSTTAALTVNFTVGGTATAGSDYTSLGSSVTLPIGQATATAVVTPLPDGLTEPPESVILTLAAGSYSIGTPNAATITIGDCTNAGGSLVNGAMHCGTISTASEIDSWTFTAVAGERIAVHIGETIDNNDFRPWIQLTAPNGTLLGNTSGVEAAAIDSVLAPLTGTYIVSVASFDSGFDGTGSYRLTMAKSPGPITVSAGDQGGALTNGGMQTGEILQGDLDVWTFTATAGERIAINVGEIADADDLRPWLRVYAPNGAVVVNTSGTDVAVLDSAAAPVTGTYLVLVASFDSGFDGAGTYRVSLAKTPGPITVAVGDQGGPLTNGALHTGTIVEGDLDVWTFTANTGDRIALSAGEIVDNDDLRPWLRLYAPNGAVLGSSSGTDAASIDSVLAPVAGTYLVLVASFDSGFDGTGTYRLTMAKTPAPITVTAGDQGGPLTNGGMQTGEILQGDLDVWTFTATAGERFAINAGEIADADDLRPWLRVYAPDGAVLANTSGTDVAVVDGVVAPVSGTYLVLVASFDSGFDGAGTYRVSLAKTPGPITVAAGDEGGPLTNGGLHTGTIVEGDLDVWTFTATTGDRIALSAGEIVDNDDLRPWLRLYAPNGAVLGSSSGVEAATIDSVLAPVTGTYLVLVASFDSGFDGTGTYRLTMAKTPAPITVSAGDQGGALTNGGMQTGEILQGDLDVWTFTATAGERIAINVGEIADADDLRPWLRVYAPDGAVVVNTSGTDVAVLDSAAAPVTGTYLVLVASFDSGFDGAGTYRVSLAKTPGPITVAAGDEGGPLTNGALHTGTIVEGDLDVWTFTANTGDRIALSAGEIVDNDDLRPWLRLYAPNGAVLGSSSGTDVASIDSVLAPVAGTYLVLVASFDSGFDGTGTYRLTLAKSPGPVSVTVLDQGGALTSGVSQGGQIIEGDLDVWTINAVAGQGLGVTVTQTGETDDFRPWLRVYAPNGAVLANTSGLDSASLASTAAPVTGTYLIIVGSFDSGFNGVGTYSVVATVSP
jgi:predicted secreted protein